MQPFDERRAKFGASLDGGVAVVPAARERLRSGDSEYPFRQDSDFYYLTGFDEPDAVLVLAPHRETERSVLFTRPRDRSQEIWTGRRLGPEAAPERLGVDAAYSIEELDARLPSYLCGAKTLFYSIGRDEGFDRRLQTALASARHMTRRSGRAPETIADPGSLLHEMRLYKSAAEVDLLRRASRITRDGHIAGMAATRAGAREYEVRAAIEYAYLRHGATPAYTSIVGGGDNALILHYTSNRDELRDGELVLVDSGCELENYATDVTRTWPVNGRFTPEQRAIYEIVLAAQQAGIDAVRPGRSCRDFHHAAVRVIADGLRDLKLVEGTTDEIIEKETYREYYMHGTGHWLGLDVHDAGRYRNGDDSYRKLEPGMVTTVEPGIYVGRELECDERFKGIGVRIEDDVLVTNDGNENLTAAIPKSIDDVERSVGCA